MHIYDRNEVNLQINVNVWKWCVVNNVWMLMFENGECCEWCVIWYFEVVSVLNYICKWWWPEVLLLYNAVLIYHIYIFNEYILTHVLSCVYGVCTS